MFSVANVKISLKTLDLPLDNVCCAALANNVVVRGRFTFIIFKSKECKDKKNNNDTLSHTNITKIKNLSEVTEALDLFSSIFHRCIINYTVDNIIATSKLNRRLNLYNISQQVNTLKSKLNNKHIVLKFLKYNNERFPGLTLRFNIGTLLLFHSGSIVILGAKTETDIS